MLILARRPRAGPDGAQLHARLDLVNCISFKAPARRSFRNPLRGERWCQWACVADGAANASNGHSCWQRSELGGSAGQRPGNAEGC